MSQPPCQSSIQDFLSLSLTCHTRITELFASDSRKRKYVTSTFVLQWQTRMHAEIIRLQTDLEQAHAEDKVAALHAQADELTQDAARQKEHLQTRLDMANAEVGGPRPPSHDYSSSFRFLFALIYRSFKGNLHVSGNNGGGENGVKGRKKRGGMTT